MIRPTYDDDNDDDDDDNNNNNNNNTNNNNNNRNVIKKEAEKILKVCGPQNTNSFHVECESKSDTGNNRGDWNHSKITQEIPEQHTRTARN